MTRTRLGPLPPVVAGGVTFLLSWLYALPPDAMDPSGQAGAVLLLVLLPVPFVVSVAWGGALLVSHPRAVAGIAAGAWLVLSLVLFGGEVTWQMAGNVLAGLGAGLAVGARWRLDAALAVTGAALAPLLVWSVVQMPVQEQLESFRAEALTAVKENLPEDVQERSRDLALAKEARLLDQAIGVMYAVYPGILAVGLLGQAGLILVLVWFLARRLGFNAEARAWPGFTRWRLPFYLVWILVLGIGLMLTRHEILAAVGLNTVLVTASVISVQGLSVQAHFVARLLPPAGRIVFWTVMGIFFVLVLLVAGVMLGLADQWLDLRRLDRARQDDSEKVV